METNKTTTISRVSFYYRSYYLRASDKTYKVNSFKFFDPKLEDIIITLGQGWLQDAKGDDIKSIELPQAELKRKTKEKLSVDEAYVISLGKENYGTDLICDLYIPIQMLNLKFDKYVKSTNYLYAFWKGNQNIVIQQYKGNFGARKFALRSEYEEILKEIGVYNLEFHLDKTLENINLLKKKALQFQKEIKRIEEFTIDEAIVEIEKTTIKPTEE